jgi:hypothetical protein
VVFDEDA